MSSAQHRYDKKCGYCGYILSQHFDLLKHSCFHPFDDTIHQLRIDENSVVTVVLLEEELNEPNNQPINESNEDIDSDELLIYYVSQKRALYDHRIPANERSTLKKNALWKEVCNSLGGILNLSDVKKRWRYLRDCFMKAKKKERAYIPSGSGADKVHKKSSFRFYEQMKFLDDVFEKSTTCTSLSPIAHVQSISAENNEISASTENNEISAFTENNDISAFTENNDISALTENNISAFTENNERSMSPRIRSNSVSLSLPSTSTGSGTFNTKKRKLDNSTKQSEEFRDCVISALQDARKPDGIDGFLLILDEALRKLPYKERSLLQLKLLSMVMEEQNKLETMSNER
ncbi:uncharacterized protein [Temnothorax nylanderi]|uniref:uncharacterized protein n=1 Tax=Temnothorax nylanderi TaxID=102681 RepID=UPI003A8C7194